MDALGAFSYLSDNIPSWVSTLSDLTAHTAAKHAEFAEAFKRHTNAPVKSRRRRNSSVCSIQTVSTRNGSQGGTRRKRGADDCDSSLLEYGDGPSIISTRHNLIIHYDGHTQKSLEEMVRNISTARNNLRKGKMPPLSLGGFRSGMMNIASRSPLPALESLAPDDQLLSTIRSTRNRGPPPVAQPRAPPNELSSFDIAEKQLELAHSLCETAAYHFLRTGSCSNELSSVKDKFTVLLDLATDEVKRLKQEQQSDVAEKEAEETPKATETASLKRPASSEGPIEVDDEEDSVQSLDLAAFRATRLRR